MSKSETSFWLLLALGLLSCFVGSIFGAMFYPTMKQFFGEYAKYGAMFIGLAISIALLLLSKKLITASMKKG
ncbi:MAG: hypothetical protein PHV33_13625 [Elusimicrobiales bacterium]|nr:hypothetical protein [Elusimicrobiales bacterium]